MINLRDTERPSIEQEQQCTSSEQLLLTVQLGRNSEVAAFQEIAAAKKPILPRIIIMTNFAVLP